MKFQSKLRSVYVILGVLTAGIAGSIYYSMSMAKIYEREKQNLSICVNQLTQQYEEMILSMEDVSYYLLSDGDTLAAITAISCMERSEKTSQYFIDAENVISSQENNDYLSKKFYRVVFCNDNCEPIANHNQDEKKIRKNIDYKEMPWYEKAKVNPDTFTIMGIHKDTWGEKTDLEVFSVIKEIQGANRGYIEVQLSLKEVQDRLQIADKDLNVCLLNDDGELLYQNREVDMVFCRSLLCESDISPDEFAVNNGEKYLTVGEYSEETNTMLLVYKDSAVIREGTSYVIYMCFFLMGGMVLFSLLYVTISTRHLTKPMIQLQELIEDTSLETLDQSVSLDFIRENDEFQRMGQIYENMKNRLHKAVLHEKQLSTLQLQAQFDMLQAQINPHFIYNVLNVISNRGIRNGDEVICDICDDLAGMLRYSTDTKRKYAALKEEVRYLELYFSLLKYRYEHKLEYSVWLDEAIEEQTIPKIVIQQLVENSIAHGFKNTNGVMRISVMGYMEDGCWYIKVSDNGCGFSVEIQRELEEQMEQLKEDLAANRRNVECKIGGMGILNTFARLYLQNTENLVFEIGNRKEGGAEILIGAAMGCRVFFCEERK